MKEKSKQEKKKKKIKWKSGGFRIRVNNKHINWSSTRYIKIYVFLEIKNIPFHNYILVSKKQNIWQAKNTTLTNQRKSYFCEMLEGQE